MYYLFIFFFFKRTQPRFWSLYLCCRHLYAKVLFYTWKWGTWRLRVDQCNLKSIFQTAVCVYEGMRMEKTTHASENRVSAEACFNMDGQFYLLIGWCLLQEQIYGRGFNYWRQRSVLRAVGNAWAFTIRRQNLWQYYIFITRDIFYIRFFFNISSKFSEELDWLHKCVPKADFVSGIYSQCIVVAPK